MIDQRRREMLEAMGLTVWRRREHSGAAADTAIATRGPDAAHDWSSLTAGIASCERCPLHATRYRAVPGVGDRRARLMVIGEAPGAEEDRRGEPFVGRAGQLLDAMLAAIGLDRHTDVFITNVVKSRPPENRDPRAEEIEACRPWLDAQLALVKPAVILALGRVSAQSLTQRAQRIGELRNQWHRFGEAEIPLRATYHPAYLLRRPAAKARAWDDLVMVKRQLRAGTA
jgi:DNA polymerase